MSKLDDKRGALQIASDSCAHACEPRGWTFGCPQNRLIWAQLYEPALTRCAHACEADGLQNTCRIKRSFFDVQARR